ncbi:MAG: thioredoxin-dependent thiol peroxidase [Miltoncostaeaceae bacterium]
MARLDVGDPAPDFSLQADDGSTVTLSGLRGGRVVIYFYPKDATPGCTTQACEYRDAAPDFEAAGATVLGISPDPVASHQRFAAKQGLNFPLLSDPEHEVAEAYGVWVQKSMYGKTYMGIERSSFVIGADGTIEQARYKVKSKGDAAGALAALRG